MQSRKNGYRIRISRSEVQKKERVNAENENAENGRNQSKKAKIETHLKRKRGNAPERG